MVSREGPTSGCGPAGRLRRWADGRKVAREGGFSLVEICITVAIMGIALALLVGSMATAESTSDLVALRSQAESYARRIGELVRSPAVPLQCNTASLTTSYTTAINTALAGSGGTASGFSFTVTDAAFTTDQNNTDPSTWTRNSCPGGTTPLLEWVQIKVTADSRTTVSATVGLVQRAAST